MAMNMLFPKKHSSSNFKQERDYQTQNAAVQGRKGLPLQFYTTRLHDR